MKPSELVNLGQDRTRMKDPRDVERQHETVRVLLERFFHEDPERRFELQVLADEVGMGKTFVSLAVAFSMLQADHCLHEDLRGTYRKVLVLVPQNDALFVKWQREVGEFRRRCLAEEDRDRVARRFASAEARRPDEIVAALTRLKGPQVVVAKTSSLGAAVQHLDAKAQLVLSVLFRTWGTSFRNDSRRRLLKAAGQQWGWPEDPDRLGDLPDSPEGSFVVEPDKVIDAVRAYAARRAATESLDDLLERCRETAGCHFVEDRISGFKRIRTLLADFYKQALFTELLRRDLPLVIVDEAHNWKNHRNNYDDFIQRIAPLTRRVLMLTATPFQLRPDEMLQILTPTDHMKIGSERRERLELVREREIRAVLDQSAAYSRRFSREWSRLGDRAGTPELAQVWATEPIRTAVAELRDIADRPGALRTGEIEVAVDRGARTVQPRLRTFFKEALQLYAYNRDLSHELGDFVVRHRRHTGHRLVRVGSELTETADHLAARSGAHALHAAPGIDVRGEAELPHYLLMRASSEIKEGKGKASLGASLTGCFSTLFVSAESRKFAKAVQGRARVYVDLLKEMVGNESADARHPKMAAVVADVLERWERGEKTLLFTFRTNTANRLVSLLEEGVQQRLEARQLETFGGPEGLERLRQRLTSRERDLIPLVLDRVLWSMHWAPPFREKAIHTELFCPQSDDYREVARLALRFGVDLVGQRLDRVFLHRAAECAQARRVLRDGEVEKYTRRVLECVADESWVARAYGGDWGEDDETDALIVEKGVHTVYDGHDEPTPDQVDTLRRGLIERDTQARREGRRQVIRSSFDGPNLWLGADAQLEVISGCELPVDVEVDLRDQRLFHIHLRNLTWLGQELDWGTRALTMQAVRRAALRETLLTRLLPTGSQLEEDSWHELLLRRFTEPLSDGTESMLRRLAVFLEDLAAADGSLLDPRSARGGIFDATRTAKQTGVVLVDGGTKPEQRNRYFAGFNTPLSPEILVCTSVGQEGIDLHRQCRNVVHYDLAWNPATLEQRTGRVDRIGCLALRERQLQMKLEGSNGGGVTHSRGNGSSNGAAHHLEVAVPYLAGTYDERMFEELRLRAQTFEVLTGGDLAPDHAEGHDDRSDEAEGEELASGLVALPPEMVKELRVNLAVYGEA